MPDLAIKVAESGGKTELDADKEAYGNGATGREAYEKEVKDSKCPNLFLQHHHPYIRQAKKLKLFEATGFW